MPNQEFKGPVDQVIVGNVENHYETSPLPPPGDGEKSVQCPQCSRPTWRYSRHCMHCRLDLERWQAPSWWRRAFGWLLPQR